MWSDPRVQEVAPVEWVEIRDPGVIQIPPDVGGHVVIIRADSPEGAIAALLLWKERYPEISRIWLADNVPPSFVARAVNDTGVFRILSEGSGANEFLAAVKAAEDRYQKARNRREVIDGIKKQNQQLESLASGLERLISERTSHLVASKSEEETRTQKLRELNQLIRTLGLLSDDADFLPLLRQELKHFHKTQPPLLVLWKETGLPEVHYWQGPDLRIKIASHDFSIPERMDRDDREAAKFLANLLQRPFAKVLTLPLIIGSRRACLLVEHSLSTTEVEMFAQFLEERRSLISTALDRILLEKELVAASLSWEQTFDGIHEPVAIVNVDFEVLRANQSFLGKRDEAICFKSFAGRDSSCDGCPLVGFAERRVGRVKRQDRVYHVHSYPIVLPHQKSPTTFVNYYEDVTEDEQLQSLTVQNEKMAALGGLAGNIAHELNNPLTGIRAMAQILLAETPKGTNTHNDLQEIETAAERCQNIIRNLLEFSKVSMATNRRDVSLNSIVQNTLPFLKTAMRRHRSELDLSDDDVTVHVEPHLVQQVIYNLANNACQAMSNGGTLTLRTGRVRVNNTEWAEVQVIDTGPGIPPEIQSRLFEAFFTTKDVGVGTGLGLYITRSILDRMGGQISFTTVMGKGTSFSVRLPLAPQAEKA